MAAKTIQTLLIMVLWVGRVMADDSIGFSVIHTANTAGTQEALVVDSGSWWVRRKLVQTAVLIRHPQGDLLIDSGLGRQIDAQFSENGAFDRQLFKYENVDPVADQLSRHHYPVERLTQIIPTHLHWDHASGLVDFPGVPVRVRESEYRQAISGKAPVHLQSQFSDSIHWQFMTLNLVSYAGFAQSLDIYGDGSVVIVDLSGHSAGQVGVFLTVSSGQQYFFIGDTTWTIKGVSDDSERPRLLKWLVDVNWDNDKNREQIHTLNRLYNTMPDLIIVPAHDEQVMAQLPKYPEFSY